MQNIMYVSYMEEPLSLLAEVTSHAWHSCMTIVTPTVQKFGDFHKIQTAKLPMEMLHGPD